MPYVTPRQAANALGVNPRTFARWSEDGKIKTIKTDSGQRRYDIASYLKQKSATTELTRPLTKLPVKAPCVDALDETQRAAFPWRVKCQIPMTFYFIVTSVYKYSGNRCYEVQ